MIRILLFIKGGDIHAASTCLLLQLCLLLRMSYVGEPAASSSLCLRLLS